MKRRVVLHISGLAKLGLTAAMIGVALALYARNGGAEWARTAGLLLLMGGAGLYAIERIRAWRRPRD